MHLFAPTDAPTAHIVSTPVYFGNLELRILYDVQNSTLLKPLGTRAFADSGCIFVLCTFLGGGYVHLGIDTLDTITLLENGGYFVIVSTVLGYLVIVSSVLRVKCYSVQGTGYRVIVSRVPTAGYEFSENTAVKG